MQDRFNQYTQQALQALIPLGQRLTRLGHYGLIYLQRLVNWAQSVDLPPIPLTVFQWILLIYFIVGLAYLTATPLLEASDELWHVGMVEYIVENHDLPFQQPGVITRYRQEGSQPPLYYALSAAVIGGFDLSDLDSYRERNPHAKAGIPGAVGNKNLVLHDAPIEPLSSVTIALYLLRLLGLLMGMVTIWCVYQCAKLLSPQRPAVALVAAGITAFNPMFLFISASVNNDNLVIMLNSLTIYYTLITLKDGFDSRRSGLIAVLVALASLTKLSALVLVPLIFIAAFYVARRTKNWQGFTVLGTAMFAAWAVLAGWWYVRNLVLYAELFGTARMAAVAGVRDMPFTITTALAEFEGFRRFFWGVFGAANVQGADLLYVLIDFTVFTSMFGVVFLVAQLAAISDFRFARHELTQALFMLGVILLGMIAFFTWTAQTYATQGRLLFPFFAAISPILAAGLVEVVWWMLFLLSPPDRSFVQAGQAVSPEILQESVAWVVRFLGLVALLIPFTVIAPQYIPPVTVEALPTDAQPIYAQYGDMELLGYKVFDRRYIPGESVRLTFYWKVNKTSERDYSLGIGLIDPAGNMIGKLDTYPGAGTLRTSRWEAGKIYEDEYVVNLTSLLQGRFPFRVQVQWWWQDLKTVEYLKAQDAEQQPIDVILNVGAVISSDYEEPLAGILRLDEARQITFDDKIRLIGFGFDRQHSVLKLRWASTGTAMDVNYRAFVHVVSQLGTAPLGQGDAAPELPTQYWRLEEKFTTVHAIQYPDGLRPGNYWVVTGWYDPETQDRLPLPLPPDAPEGQEASTWHALFSFTVDSEGNILSPELDELEKTLQPFELPEEATPEATAEATGESTAEATSEGTAAPAEATGESAAEATSESTAAPIVATESTAEMVITAEQTAENTPDATQRPTATARPRATAETTQEATAEATSAP